MTNNSLISTSVQNGNGGVYSPLNTLTASTPWQDHRSGSKESPTVETPKQISQATRLIKTNSGEIQLVAATTLNSDRFMQNDCN